MKISSSCWSGLMSPHVRYPRQSWILDSKLWIPNFFLSGTWIPDSHFSRIPDSLSEIPKSKALDAGFHKEKFPGFRNPDNLTCGDWWLHHFFFSFDVIVMQPDIQITCHFIVD